MRLEHDARHEDLAYEFKAGYEDAQDTRDAEMRDGSPDIQPAALVPYHVEEIQRQHICQTHDDHEKRTGRDAESTIQDAEIRGNEGERYHELQEEQGALAEGVEDGQKTKDGVETEGGDAGDVAGAEEGGL